MSASPTTYEASISWSWCPASRWILESWQKSLARTTTKSVLFFLMLLRRPRTRVLFLTSQAIHSSVVDYYLHLLSGVPTSHARKRLILMDCADASSVPLSGKLLSRPRMMRQIRNVIQRHESAHMVCFNSSALERTLAVQLGIPLYANDPSLLDLHQVGCRETFREAGILFLDGFERLHRRMRSWRHSRR